MTLLRELLLQLSRLRPRTSICEDAGSIPGLAQWVKGSSIAVSCGVGCRHSWDPTLLWLWCSSDWTHSLGTSICRRCRPGKAKKKNQKTLYKNQKFLKIDFLSESEAFWKSILIIISFLSLDYLEIHSGDAPTHLSRVSELLLVHPLASRRMVHDLLSK